MKTVRIITIGEGTERVIQADAEDVVAKGYGLRVFNYPGPNLWTLFPWHQVVSVQLVEAPVREKDETEQAP